MIDPSGILGLLADLSSEWRNPSEALISPLSDVENEPACQRAVAEGLRWGRRAEHRMYRAGWRPLTERDRIGRPIVFMDAKKELLLMFRRRNKGRGVAGFQLVPTAR